MRVLPAPFISLTALAILCLAGTLKAQDFQANLSLSPRSISPYTAVSSKPGSLAAIERDWSLSGLDKVPHWEAKGPWDIDLGLPTENVQEGRKTNGHGLRVVSLNAFRRWSDSTSPVSPYLGAGIGIELTHGSAGLNAPAFMQLPNRAKMQFTAGAALELDDNVSVFGQLQSGYAFNLNEGATTAGATSGRLTNGINIGISLGF